MRKITFLLSFFAIILYNHAAFSQSFTVNSIKYNVTDVANKTVEVGNHSYDITLTGAITIPETVTNNSITYTVASFGLFYDGIEDYNSSFIGCTGITSVSIPNTITAIPKKAFYSCNNLTSVTIPSSVTSIGNHVFQYCTKLVNITIPNSVISIGMETFFNSGITSITIPNSVTSIGSNAFSVTGLTSITLPSSITTISSYLFQNCSSLTSVTLESTNLTSIAAHSFRGCTSLTNLTLYTVTPPTLDSHSFYQTPKSNIDLNIKMATTCASPNPYSSSSAWAGFKSYNCTVEDTASPVFENSTPSSSTITQTEFTLNTDIDEAGTIYYVAVADGATAPTSAEVKAGTGSGGSGQVTSGNAAVSTGSFTNTFSVTGLTGGTAYDVYVVAEDDEGTPNLQATPTLVNVTTLMKPVAKIVISEIMYNPPEAGTDQHEYIELYNAESFTVDLTGYSFSKGVTYTFTSGSIAPGGYFVIAVNKAQLDVTYGAGTADVQWTGGGLSNGGEEIELLDSSSRIVDYLRYDDINPWPFEADGNGPSIRLLDLTSDNSLGSNWSASVEATGFIVNGMEVKGTPGSASVSDTTKPVITVCAATPANISANTSCEATALDLTGVVTATDNSGVAPVITQSPVAGATLGLGTTTITITATDGSGNKATCTVSQTVVDSTKPSVSCPGNQTATPNGSGAYILSDYTGAVTATDNCSGSPVVTQSPAAGTVLTQTTTVTITATDGTGNTDTCTFDVIVPDNTAPVFENSTPSASSITQTTFTLNTDIDEAGTIFYVLRGDASEPTSSQVVQGSSGLGQLDQGNALVGSGDFVKNFSIVGLSPGYKYYVYVVAQDDEGTPNLQATPTRIEIITIANTAPTFTSTAITAVNEGDTYNYNITTNDTDGDAITVTATTKPNWLTFGKIDMLSTIGAGTVGNIDGDKTTAQFHDPTSIAVDASGNMYVGTNGNYTGTHIQIRKITPDGTVSTFAGAGNSGSLDGTGTNATFSNIYGMDIDNAGNVYVADGNSVRKITPDRVVTTLGNINQVIDVVVDSEGNVYGAEYNTGHLYKIVPGAAAVLFAASATGGQQVAGLSIDDSNNVYISSRGGKIFKVTPAAVVTEEISGLTINGGLARDGNGNFYYTASGVVNKVDISNGVETTVMSGIGQTWGVDVSTSGNVYAVDRSNHQIKTKVNNIPVLTGNTLGNAGSYDVTLSANDGNGGITTQNFTITVVGKPTVTTTDASDISASSVTLGGNVTDTGYGTITERGIVYSITTTDADPQIGDTGVIKVAIGSGDGAFSQAITGLDPSKEYTFNTYAINSAGTSYGTEKTVVLDITPPTIVVSGSVSEYTNAPFVTTFTFSEAITNFALSDITIVNGTASIFNQINSTTYTAVIVPTTDGLVNVSLASGTLQDLADNDNTVSNIFSITYDRIKPSLIITSDTANPSNATSFVATFTFSEDVADFDESFFTMTNATSSNFVSVSDAIYTVTITPTVDGTVTIDVTEDEVEDNAANGNTAATYSVFVDTVVPGVSITSPVSNPTNVAFTATFTFSEYVTGFDVTDITLDNATASDFANVSVVDKGKSNTSGGNKYTALITPTIDGNVTIDVAADVATDQATNGNTAATQFSTLYDATNPTVVISSTVSNPTNAAFTTTFTFSEYVTGFDVSDITLTNATASDFKIVSTPAKSTDVEFGNKYTVLITPTTEGLVTIDIAADVANDRSTNGNEAATQFSTLYDITNPTVIISSTVANPANGAFTTTFTFSEAVTGFDISDITLANGNNKYFGIYSNHHTNNRWSSNN